MKCKILNRKVFNSGHTIFREGDQADHVYYIQSGTVDIFRSRRDGEAVLGRLGKGAIFGEMALIDDQPRMASARVPHNHGCVCIVISKQDFLKKLEGIDPLVHALLASFVRGIRAFTDFEVPSQDTPLALALPCLEAMMSQPQAVVRWSN